MTLRILTPQKWLFWGPIYPCYTTSNPYIGRLQGFLGMANWHTFHHKCVTQTSTHSAATSPSTSSGLTRPLPRTQEPFVLAKSLLRINVCSNTGSVECFMKGKCLKMFHVGQCGNLPPQKKVRCLQTSCLPNMSFFFHLPNQISPASYTYQTHRLGGHLRSL